jgi:glycosyltransferase involved in cell wall biosynthesis
MAGKVAEALGIRASARKLVAMGQPREPDLRQIRARFQASKSAFSHVDRFLSPSQDLGRRMAEAGWAPADRIHVQDLPLIQPIRALAPPKQGPLRFLFVGSLIPTKGPHVLLKAAEGLDCQVHFFGPTPGFDGHPGWGEALVEAISNQDNAHYGGVFEDSERNRVYGEADVLVLPSTWEENSPLVLREGLAAGLPVVGSRVGGLAELAPEGRFVAANSVEALRNALQEEMALGHRRLPPKDWPMTPHVEALQRHYRALLPGKSAHAPNI